MVRLRRLLVSAAVSLTLLTACTGQNVSGTAGNGLAAALVGHGQRVEVSTTQKNSSKTLYVLDYENGAGVVRVYKNRGSSFFGEINTERTPISFAVDNAGILYVANFEVRDGRTGTLSLYGNRGSKLLRSWSQRGGFSSLTPDSDGNLYSGCPSRRFCEYPDANKPASRKFKGVGWPLATHASGNLAVGYCGLESVEACVFAPGQQVPYWTISTGVETNNVDGLAFDAQGDLYVDNQGNTAQSEPGSIAVYSPTESSPSRVITTGIVGPLAIAFDGKGNLYVYNSCAEPACSTSGGSVTVYAPGASTPFRTITDGVVRPSPRYAWAGSGSPLAVDGDGYVYIVNAAHYVEGRLIAPTIVVYKPGAKMPVRVVTDIQQPIAVDLGP